MDRKSPKPSKQTGFFQTLSYLRGPNKKDTNSKYLLEYTRTKCTTAALNKN